MRKRKKTFETKDLCITTSDKVSSIRALGVFDGIEFKREVSKCCNTLLLVVAPIILDEPEVDWRYGCGISLCMFCEKASYLNAETTREHFK